MTRHTTLYILLIVAIVFTLAGCTGQRRGGVVVPVQPTNEGYTEARVLSLYDKEPERALAIIDSAEVTGIMSDFHANLLRAKLFSASVQDQRQEQARQICESLLRHDSVRASANNQCEVLLILVNASRMRHDDEQWMRWAMELSKLQRRLGNEAEALRMEAEMGLVLTHLGEEKEGMEKIDRAIEVLDGQRRFGYLNALILASKRKIVVLRETGHHADILPVAQHIQDRLADFEANPDDYADGSDGEPKSEEDRADYCDFYGAQATAFKAAAYAATGRLADARREFGLFGCTNYGHTLDGRKMIAPTLGLLGDYDKMLAIYDEAEAELRGDTLRNDYADILLARAKATEAQGRLAVSLSYRKRYEALLLALNTRLQRSQAHDYAARYHAQENQMEIDRREAKAERYAIISVALAVGLVGAIIFAIYFFWQKRLVGRKNRVLVEQISDAIEYKKRYEALHAAPDNAAPPHPTREGDNSGTSEAPDLNSLSDEQLFQYMSDVILREKLYLNPVCDRQTITDRFGISEKRVGAAFSKGSAYKSLPSFIRDSRLEYACQLLRQNPEMTIGNVATASGFSNHTRFTADFKTRYSVSPTEYRSLSV